MGFVDGVFRFSSRTRFQPRITTGRSRRNSAQLLGADLREANLSWADLRGANLSEAHLSGADLRGAHFSRARLGETVFGHSDLTGARGLEKCRHMVPSTLDHRTIAKPGELPLSFLRGVGLPDRLIEYLP